MKPGPLTPEQQLDVLARIWGKDRDGYVFLPWIDGSARSPERRRKSYHEGKAYEWPSEREAVLEHLRGHERDDVYFTPALFNAKRRTEQNVDAERTLWADLDPVDPHGLDDLRPTIAWETSVGRYQGVWLLDRAKVGASWPSKENHRLSLHLGADPSGWDATQLLRVPGRRNHKPDYGGPDGVEGRLLWDNGPRYVWEDFAKLPEVGPVESGEDIELLDEELLAGVDRHQIWSTVRLKVSHRARERMAARGAPSDAEDRSAVLWELERELADAGCSILEIVVLVRGSVWNKYAGRNDELKRLKIEAAKAIAARSDELEKPAEEEEAKPSLLWLSELAQRPIARPRWLVDDVWTRGGCGFIAGAPKSYKSWLALDLAVSVASGRPWLGLSDYTVRRARPVLYVQEEDDLRLVMSRLASVTEARAPGLYWHGVVEGLDGPYRRAGVRWGVDPGVGLVGSVHPVWRPPTARMPLAVHVQGGFTASDPGWQVWLSELIAEGAFGLVLIDTLGTSAGDVDTDRAGELMGKILKPLKTIAQQTDAAICLVHHNRKGQPEGRARAGSEMLGSVALHAWVDCAIYARSREGGELTLEREAKQAPDLKMKIKIPRMYENVHTGERQLWAPELVTEDETEESEPETKPAEKRVRGEGPMNVKLKTVGFDRGSLPRDYVNSNLGADLVRRLLRNGTLTELPDGRLEWKGRKS